MFTGIVTGLGKVIAANRPSANEAQIIIETPFEDVAVGESIAVNGVCLTAESVEAGRLVFFASAETCAKTALGSLEKGHTVNLERALRLGDRLSGHIVQGHVDGVASLVSTRSVGESHELKFALPKGLDRYVIDKGSIALDGISLTVNSIEDPAVISVMIIPHTWANTTLAGRRVGDHINVEVDMLAKYAERQQSRREVSP